MCVCLVNYMLQLSLNYGVCKESSFALASFSGLLFGLGDLKASKKSSHFALSLLDRLNCKEMLPRVYICVYSSALIKHETSKKVSEKFLYGYEVGMQTGDILFAMYCARTYCTQRFFCGVGLDELVRDIEVWRQQMIAYKQMWNLNIFNSFRHKVLTLINYSDDNLQQFNDLFAEGMKSLKSHIEQKRHLPATVLCSYFSCTAYFFCEYDFARDMIETKWKLEKNIKRKYWAVGAAKFYETLICIALARETNEDKWRKYALQCFEEEKKLNSSELHRLLILETEIDIIIGKTKNTITNYNKAINAARESQHIHEEAIANERAGDFCLSQDDIRASHYYGQAYSLYLQWGAKGKAAQIKRNYLKSGIFQ